jgi:hypothetical protein
MTADAKREYLRKYNIENRERIAAQRKRYRQENKDKVAQQKREYAESNKDKNRLAHAKKYQKYKERYLLQMKEKYLQNADEIKRKRMEYYYKNKEKILASQKQSAQRDKEKLRPRKAAYCRNRRAKDPTFLLIGRLRCRINDALRYKKFPKSGKTRDVVGCDMQTLKAHIENQFKNGMTWQNRDEWHIDHIVPLASAKTPEEIYSLFHYKNLQPLWGVENMAKGAKMVIND